MEKVTESSGLGLPKNIGIADNSPHIKSVSTGQVFDSLNIGIWYKIPVNHVSNELLSVRSEERPTRIIGRKWGEYKALRQWKWQNGCLGSETDIMRGSVSGIYENCPASKFNVLFSFLIKSGADLYADISPKLLCAAFGADRYAVKSNLGIGLKVFGSVLHGDSQTIGFSNRTLHGLALVGSGLNGLSQTSSLQSENNQLEKPYSPENGRDNNQITSEVYEFPIVRRFIFAVFGLLGGFFLSLWGWYLFDKDRRLLGASLVGLGWLLGALGLTLLILTDYPSTWRWIL